MDAAVADAIKAAKEAEAVNPNHNGETDDAAILSLNSQQTAQKTIARKYRCQT